jgi:uncharacterized protein YbaR (Trm112 family)
MKNILCPSCLQQTKLYYEKYRGLKFVFVFQICKLCKKSFKINSNGIATILQAGEKQ